MFVGVVLRQREERRGVVLHGTHISGRLELRIERERETELAEWKKKTKII